MGADGASPQLTRPAQDLLMAVCVNCGTHSAEDVDVISHLVKIHLKPKVLLNHYMLCVRCARQGAAAGGCPGGGPAHVSTPLLGSCPGSC